MANVEIWGGVECTVNRVGDRWFNQLELSGHATRLEDLELIADLGLRTLRYPVLWELTTDPITGEFLWSWADQRLARLRQLGIRPIVGLVHHGSGPACTNLLNDNFATGLARFAGAVAARYPWLGDFTPVNEPLTTARFSALYGLWYPHRRDDASFCRALINQVRGTVLAMIAIRAVNPQARLIQTEDLGTTHSTPYLGYQREFDNERRWLTWDLLCGRVGNAHPLRSFLLQNGVTAEELGWLEEHPCPPDLIGVNHYITSDRFLDERTTHYPAEVVGANSIDEYVDLPAVRVLPGAYRGWRVLESAWERYHIPLALTEVHLGCTREEQLRWFQDAWSAALAAQQGGCDVRAVTSWALFGSYDWDCLLTQQHRIYEPGAFDVSSTIPRPTAIAHMLRALCLGERHVHPTMGCAGWWQRSSKLSHGQCAEPLNHGRSGASADAAACVWICGVDATLGHALLEVCARRNLRTEGTDRHGLDTGDAQAIDAALRRSRPWAIIAAWGIDNYQLRCAARRLAIPFLTFSDRVHRGAQVPSWTALADAGLDRLIDDARGFHLSLERLSEFDAERSWLINEESRPSRRLRRDRMAIAEIGDLVGEILAGDSDLEGTLIECDSCVDEPIRRS